MIDIQVKLHDRYSVECKVGYHVDRDTEENEFRMNTWFFVPHSLDINASTYPKEAFYRDVKSNVRLITPIYTLEEDCEWRMDAFRFLGGCVPAFGGGWDEGCVSLLRVPDQDVYIHF